MQQVFGATHVFLSKKVALVPFLDKQKIMLMGQLNVWFIVDSEPTRGATLVYTGLTRLEPDRMAKDSVMINNSFAVLVRNKY